MNITVVKTILDQAQSHPNKTALMYKKTDRYASVKYKELARLVQFFASGLLSRGIEKEDRVAILSANRPEWVIADLGTQLIGAITVPIHTTLSPSIIQYVLNHCGARVLVVSDKKQLDKILSIKKELSDLRKIIFIQDEKDSVKIKEFIDWNDFLKKGKKSALVSTRQISHQDVCSIVYTSGTTGFPKGVMLTHFNFLSNIEGAMKYVSVTRDDIFLSFLPLSHIFERTAGYYIALFCGATIAYAESFLQLKDNLKEVRPTILVAVPRVFEKIHAGIWSKMHEAKPLKRKIFMWSMKQKKGTWQYKIANALVFKKIRNAFGGRIRLVVTGGAALNEKLAKFFSKVGLVIVEGYGLTETSPIISVNKDSKIKFGSVGVVLQNVEVKISDDKEILARGPSIMKGYYKDDTATNEAIDSSEWFHTGDQGFIDNEGFLFITGRKKEMIVTAGGKNIWPAVLENALNANAFIQQSLVVGNKRKYISALIVVNIEEVKKYAFRQNIAFQNSEELITKPEIQKLFSEYITKATASFPDYEKIIRFTLLTKPFSQENDELTPTLKLRRTVITNRYHKEIEMMYNEKRDKE